MSTIENIVKSLAYATEHNQGLHLTHEEVPALLAHLDGVEPERAEAAMKDKPKLKPCPFCGEMPKVNTWTMHGITESRCFCDNEKCPVYLSKTIAIDDWNTRPIEDALNARIAELELRLDVYNGNMYDVVVDENAKANKRIAELEAERRWIPVSERLPEIGFTGLCQVAGNGYVIARYAPYDSEGGWTSDEIGYCFVTHWMPLPPPPELPRDE